MIPPTSPLPVYQDILNQGLALQQTLDYQLGPGKHALNKAAAAVRDAKRLTVSSIGASYSASLPFIYRLGVTGNTVLLEDASELLHYKKETAGPGSVYILASRSGETIEIVRLLDDLKGRGVQIIGITNEPDSQLARLSDIPLVMGCPRDNLIAIQTYSATLLTFHLLAEFVLGVTELSSLKLSMEKLLGQVHLVLDEYNHKSKGWVDGFRHFTNVELLARGASLASAKQAALLFHEMARFPVSSWSIGEFRHGPWEVVDENLCNFVFIPRDHTQELNQAFAIDLAGMGGRVHVVSSIMLESVLGNLSILPVPEVDPYLTPLLEIIPLQFFIYEYALWRGLTPGVFRASTPITLSETGSLKNS